MRRGERALIACGAVVFAFTSCFALRHKGSTRFRVAAEQGIELPESARNLECAGDAWLAPMDSGSVAVFEMEKRDLPRLTGQLLPKWKSVEGQPASCGPANLQYQTAHRSWMNGKALLAQDGPSKMGDMLILSVWTIDDAHVGVCLYTDWN